MDSSGSSQEQPRQPFRRLTDRGSISDGEVIVRHVAVSESIGECGDAEKRDGPGNMVQAVRVWWMSCLVYEIGTN